MQGLLPEGIHAVSRDQTDGSLHLEYDPERTNEEALKRYARELDEELARRFSTCAWRLEGRGCELCANRLAQRLEEIPGVRRAHASYLGGRLTVD